VLFVERRKLSLEKNQQHNISDVIERCF